MIETDRFEQVEVRSAEELRTWLERNHDQESSVWLVTFKKSHPARYVSVAQILDELLCFGWVDGVRRRLDDDRTMQLISPRRVRHWSKTYKDRVDRLTREGRMHAAGLQAVARAQSDGSWDAMDDVDTLTVPDDLRAALDIRPAAAAWFDAAAPSYRRNALRWLKIAKTAATRAKRVAAIVTSSAQGKKLPQM